MVSKVNRSPGCGCIGRLSSPRLVLRAKRFEEIPAILANTKTHPTPVRMVGADYSQTRCVGGDGGTPSTAVASTRFWSTARTPCVHRPVSA